jgi:hypothetical protein
MICVFENPRHDNGGCIFADPSVITVPSGGSAGGGFGPGAFGVQLDIGKEDDEIIMMCIKEFLTVIQND